MKCFTTASGKSLYLYPMQENIEISEQDFYLTKKLQRYIKEENAIIVQEYDAVEPVRSSKVSNGYSSKSQGKSKPKKFAAKKYLEDNLNERS